MITNRLAADIELLDRSYPDLWRGLERSRILVTGGTGFFGGWLLESILWAMDNTGLDSNVTVLTRDPVGFRRRRPLHAAHRRVSLIQGDILRPVSVSGHFTHVVHCAAPMVARNSSGYPEELAGLIADGTRNALSVARNSGASRFLLTSSGAVYGTRPHPPGGVTEEVQPPGVLFGNSASDYGMGKRMAEDLAVAASVNGLAVTLARCFAFAGPFLPLDRGFAIGNFVRDALGPGPVRIKGDGISVRSYLYGSDLAAWIWRLLADGEAGRPYNVGSERAISMVDLARLVAQVLNCKRGVEIAQGPNPSAEGNRYIPSTYRAKSELSLTETIGLEAGVLRMAECASQH